MAAPKSNTNALKHGLYAKQFNESQRLGLRKMAWEDIRHEQYVLRCVGAELYRLLNLELAKETPDIDQVVKLAASLAKNAISTGTSARTFSLLTLPDEKPFDPLAEALEIEPFDLCEPGEAGNTAIPRPDRTESAGTQLQLPFMEETHAPEDPR